MQIPNIYRNTQIAKEGIIEVEVRIESRGKFSLKSKKNKHKMEESNMGILSCLSIACIPCIFTNEQIYFILLLKNVEMPFVNE